MKMMKKTQLKLNFRQYQKLKAYRAQDIRTEKTVGWRAIGIKYDKKKIDELEKLLMTISKFEKILKKDGLDDETIIEIKENILKSNRRKDDYVAFRKRNYSFYPIKIKLKVHLMMVQATLMIIMQNLILILMIKKI